MLGENTHNIVKAIFLFLLIPVLCHAKIVDYRNLPDSLRLKIRLESYLLLSPESTFPDTLLASLSPKIPMAVYSDGSDSLMLTELLMRISPIQSRILLVAENKIPVPESIQAEIVFCNSDCFDGIGLTSDTIDPHIFDSFFTQKELLKVELTDTLHARENCMKLWQNSGKLPNLVQAGAGGFRQAAGIVFSLNKTKKIYGAVFENSQLLTDVYWEGEPVVKTSGYFCFPLISGDNKLIPYKAGYHFSPDIIYQSESNRNDMKIFYGIRHEMDYGLTDDFIFKNKVQNIRRGNGKEIINNGVAFKKESGRGWVAEFKNKAYIDAGLQSYESLKSDFSVTAWIRPTTQGPNNSILGKGREFVLKIRKGLLTYTMLGIKDYVSGKTQVPLNKWAHIAVTYSVFTNRIDFYLNGKHTDQMNLIVKYAGSDNTLIIGSNLWEEFFNGDIGEIKIWNRKLSDDEIKSQFSASGSRDYTFISAIFLIAVLGSGLFIYFIPVRKRKKQPAKPQPVHKISPISDILPDGEKVLCFGGLKLIDSSETNVFRKFSPKMKQLFLLIYLYSFSKNKGISSKQLTEALWAGMNTTNAKNSRGTYIQNLKTALSAFQSVRLVFNDKLWSFNLNENCYNEFNEVSQSLDGLFLQKEIEVIEKQLPPLLAVLKRGRFLDGTGESWADPFIEKTHNRIIEFCLSLFPALDTKKHATLLYGLTEIIGMYDPLNEPSLQKRIELLVGQGKLSLARSTYDNFTKLYKELYNEEYPSSYKDLVSENF